MNKSLIVAVAIILVIGIAAGILVLTNQNSNDNTDNSSDNLNNRSETIVPTPSATTVPDNSGIAAFQYDNGTYSANGSYTSPGGTESVNVSLKVENDIVASVTVTGSAKAGDSKLYQNLFIKGISGEVVGKKLDGLSVGRVNGSSLTGGGFNKAIREIQAQALN
jgi:hypothetical protein